MWNMLWNLMAVLGIFCCTCLVVLLIWLGIDEWFIRKSRKNHITYTQYFTEEDAKNDRRNETET